MIFYVLFLGLVMGSYTSLQPMSKLKDMFKSKPSVSTSTPSASPSRTPINKSAETDTSINQPSTLTDTRKGTLGKMFGSKGKGK